MCQDLGFNCVDYDSDKDEYVYESYESSEDDSSSSHSVPTYYKDYNSDW